MYYCVDILHKNTQIIICMWYLYFLIMVIWKCTINHEHVIFVLLHFLRMVIWICTNYYLHVIFVLIHILRMVIWKCTNYYSHMIFVLIHLLRMVILNYLFKCNICGKTYCSSKDLPFSLLGVWAILCALSMLLIY